MQLAIDNTTFSGSLAEAERHIAEADLTTLIVTCAFLSGDMGWFRPEWRPTLEYGVLLDRLEPTEVAEIRRQALELLRGAYQGGKLVERRPTMDFLHVAADWLMGPSMSCDTEGVVSLAAEENVFGDSDLRRPAWTKHELAPERDFKVVIIGAGESGILAAHRLNQAGVDFVVFEKNDEVGGTWWENRYPGCRVDCNSYFYSFACGRAEWNDFYGKAEDVGAYLKACSEAWGIRGNIRFAHEVTRCVWDDAARKWQVSVRGPQGEVTVVGDAVVSAVGQLNRPMMPDLKGMDTYTGQSFHTARWPKDLDYSGKRLGIIGTGATSLQIVPQLAKTATQVSVFARTTPWLLPTALLHEVVPEGMTWFMRNIPTYAMWYRFTLVVPGAIGMLDGVVVDPSFPPTERAVSLKNEQARAAITAWMEDQIADRPDLRDALIPTTSPVGGKRIVRDNGTWAKTLKRDNVAVVKSKIERVTAKGVSTVDGAEHELDVLVYATGFHASRFLMPMEIVGHEGKTLGDHWGGEARAYLGMTVPGFPNFFIFYGPNTNQVVHGGSAFMWSEFSLSYLMSSIETMLAYDIASVDVREDVYQDYCRRVDDANTLRAWGFSKVNSWYKNASGRVTQNYPFTSAQLWSRLKHFRKSEFNLR